MAGHIQDRWYKTVKDETVSRTASRLNDTARAFGIAPDTSVRTAPSKASHFPTGRRAGRRSG
jgi:hypothetical protein